MRARSLELNLVHMNAVGAADMAARNTELRKLDLLPSGGRGLHAPAILPSHAAYMLLGLASGITADAGTVAKAYGAFVTHDAPKSGALIDILSRLLSDQESANKIEEIRLCRTRPWVMIVGMDGSRTVYRPKSPKPIGSKDHMTGGREEYVIGGGLLHQVAIDLQLDQEFPGE